MGDSGPSEFDFAAVQCLRRVPLLEPGGPQGLRRTRLLCPHHSLPELAPTHVHRGRDAIPPSYSLLPLLLLPSISPCVRVFSTSGGQRIGASASALASVLPVNIQS